MRKSMTLPKKSSDNFKMEFLEDGTPVLTLTYIPEHLKPDERNKFLIERFKEWRDAVISEGHGAHSENCSVWKVVRDTLSSVDRVPVSTRPGSLQPGSVPGTGPSHILGEPKKGSR